MTMLRMMTITNYENQAYENDDYQYEDIVNWWSSCTTWRVMKMKIWQWWNNWNDETDETYENWQT